MIIGDLIGKLQAYGENYNAYDLIAASAHEIRLKTDVGDELVITVEKAKEKKSILGGKR